MVYVRSQMLYFVMKTLTSVDVGSPLCFFLAAYQYPTALRSMWGHMAEELSDETWAELSPAVRSGGDLGLGLLLKMTRCHDLALQDILFRGQDIDDSPDERHT